MDITVKRVGSHALHELEAIHDRHVDVRQDDVELCPGELAQAVDEELAHFVLRFKIKLVVRETKAIPLAAFFVGSNGGALHIAGIYAKEDIMRIAVLLIHVV